ncbi:LapA family protein [Pontixanthobacter aquaemixtae]|uniref:DUF1049 domain-containing protein n=1 Tax=Pontixanthobacter aquaemixtae TaxID=1958940 RepID=A0A844ZSR8_9SPHN|nr:LapA family protein [Pontixanthobacter aquaemixtae]MXO90534.1 DUF1049 domain-containing protein [Pontixanthobacter aquaemixtae]
MQIVRTIFWVLLFVGLMTFSIFNWNPVEVSIWSGFVLETRVPALVIVSFLLGMIPTWLLHRGTKWRLERRIKQLENATRAASVTQPVSPPPGTQPANPVDPARPTPAPITNPDTGAKPIP